MSELQFWNLLAKKFSGEASPEDLAQLDELMRKHPDWLFSAQYLQDIWNLESNQGPSRADEAFADHLQRMKQKGMPLPGEPIPVQKNRRWIGIVIGLLLVLSIPAFYIWNRDTGGTRIAAKKMNEVSTKGSRTKLLLPDSSVVWLNAGSRLSYSSGFGADKREVTLSGEAYFDIKKDKIPFVIHTHSIQIRVLGTAFNVKSYPNEPTTETSLVRGEVEITVNQRPGETYLLHPNEKLTISNHTDTTLEPANKTEPVISLGKVKLLEDSSIVETSWVDNRLVFKDESFGNIVRSMERWYNIPIRITDPELAEERLSGTFENETVVQALRALQISTRFQFTGNEKGITITH